MLALFLAPLLATGCGSKDAPELGTVEDLGELRTPRPEDFVFGPGDVIDIKVWRQPEMDLTVTVAPDGRITYPLLGTLEVSGLNYPELVGALEDGLDDYYVEPSVAVNIIEVSNQKVFVLGEVQNPAVLQIENDLSILEALVRTGGIHPDARTDNVLLIRGEFDDPELYLVDVQGVYTRGDTSQMVWLQRGDIVYVPARTIVEAERFFRRVQGMLAPFVAGSAVYRNAISGGAQGTSSVLD
jgi:polysaccharide biosynthesis/export protein